MKKMIESLLMRFLALDPESTLKIKKLSGTVVGITLQGTPLHCQMVFQDPHIKLLWQDFLPEDLTIKGTPLRLLQLKFSQDRQPFFTDDVHITGKMTLANEVLQIFDEWQPDWEEQASKWVGDAPAYQVGRFLKGFRKRIKSIGNRFSEQLNEYLHEESGFFPPPEEIQDFLNAIDTLRLNLDRLEARTSRLKLEQST